MIYYYIHPFKPQYFFPKGFKKYSLFLSFFSPYSKAGWVSWCLFTRVAFYRLLFVKKNIEDFIPEYSIRKIIGDDAVMAFNRGSIGPEQKITGLGVSNQKEFFIKFGQTKIAKANVTNEYNILKQITHLDIVPKVLDFHSDDTQVLLKTNVLKGERLIMKTLEKRILNKLFVIANQKVECIKTTQSSLKTSFAHGDFCPWNMMIKDYNILIYDWEMAGNYTLGYDLFTFIFQTNFLLESKKTIADILKENKKLIEHYFSNFKIINWYDYLIAFTEDKITLETSKGTKGMIAQYSKLLAYAKKA
tara:strand:+ start:9448 stop:10356 length:909 start_codon:yes stop_codon:yes gene_type:complete